MRQFEEKLNRRQVVQLGSAAMAAVAVGSGQSFASAQDAVEIEYWHINTESFGLSAVKNIIAAFEEANPGIKVTERFQTNSYTELMERVQTAVIGGNPPDVCQVGYPYLDYVAKNFSYTTIDDLVEENQDQAFLEAFNSNILDLGRVDGKVVGMPYGLSVMVVYMNADMVRDAGYDPADIPVTWDAFREMAASITAKTGKPAIHIQVSDDNWAAQTLIDSNGGSLIRCDDGNVKVGFDQPEAIEAIQFWADLVKDNLALIANPDQGQQAFFTQDIAFAFQSIARRGNFEKEATFDLSAAKVPGFEGKDIKLTTGGNCLFIFSSDEARIQAAWEFIKFCSSPEGQTIWVKETGYLPTRNDVADNPEYLKDFIQGNAIQQVAFEQVDHLAQWASFPGANGLQVGKELANAVESALSGSQSAQDSLMRAGDMGNQLLAGETCS